MTHLQSFIKQFTGADVYKSDLIAYLTHFYTDLTHFHLRSHSTHTNLMWLRSMEQRNQPVMVLLFPPEDTCMSEPPSLPCLNSPVLMHGTGMFHACPLTCELCLTYELFTPPNGQATVERPRSGNFDHHFCCLAT